MKMNGAKHPDILEANPYPIKSACARAANPWKWELSVRQSGFGGSDVYRVEDSQMMRMILQINVQKWWEVIQYI